MDEGSHLSQLSRECCQMGYPEKFWKQRQKRRLFREHRTVTLPEFQGTGCLDAAFLELKLGLFS